MAQKKITDLQLRSDFDATCNLPADDSTQTWRVTGAQMLSFVKSELNLLDAKTASFTTNNAKFYYPVDATSGAVTVTFDTASAGQRFLFKKTDSGSNTVAVASLITLRYQGDTAEVFYDGSAWQLINMIPADKTLSNTASGTSFPASTTWGDLCTLSIPPGVWDLSGHMSIQNSNTVTAGIVRLGIGTVSGDNAPDLSVSVQTSNETTNAARRSLAISPIGITLASTTSHYLKFRYDATSTNVVVADAILFARRIAIK